MGTKLKPSEHDAWDKAADDEPRVAFLARDLVTESLLRIAAAWYAGDTAHAEAIFRVGQGRVGSEPFKPGKGEARSVAMSAEANAVLNWRLQHKPKPNAGGRMPIEKAASPADIIVQCEGCGDKVISLIDGLCLTCELDKQERNEIDRDRES